MVKFDWAEFDNLLKSRGVREDCPMCGHDDWLPGHSLVAMTVLDDTTEAVLTHPVTGQVGSVSGALYLCANCGFGRFHSPQAFETNE